MYAVYTFYPDFNSYRSTSAGIETAFTPPRLTYFHTSVAFLAATFTYLPFLFVATFTTLTKHPDTHTGKVAILVTTPATHTTQSATLVADFTTSAILIATYTSLLLHLQQHLRQIKPLFTTDNRTIYSIYFSLKFISSMNTTTENSETAQNAAKKKVSRPKRSYAKTISNT